MANLKPTDIIKVKVKKNIIELEAKDASLIITLQELIREIRRI